MKSFVTTILLLTNLIIFAQNQAYITDIKKFQDELNEEFKNPEKSPLTIKEQSAFKGHNFFPIDESYSFKAKFIKTKNAIPFKMKTTTNRTPVYEKYGEVLFKFNDTQYKLSIYQSHRLRQTEKYKNHLFIPFVDLTSGDETYGGGRYIDLTIPTSDYITIDFNKAYNPYCAYNQTSSCPIPPEENYLDLKIKAGVKYIEP